MPDPNPLAISTRTHTDDHSDPILNRDNDVLWYIFSINADMEQNTEDETPALLTLWYTSQVCWRWREIAITSPKMWARILNLNLLSQTGTNWKEVVIRRTGTALLYVRTFSKIYRPQWQLKEGFLGEFLNDHWYRIRSLDLNLYKRGFLSDEETWRRLFERQAPSLEILKMKFPSPRINTPSFGITLTSNIAPVLHTLSVEYTGLNFGTLRTSTLRYLVIGSPVPALILLGALRHMPLLEGLRVSSRELRHLPQGMHAQNPPPIVRKLIRSLVSVEVLKTHLCTLDCFQNMLVSYGIIALPALKIIYLECRGELDNLGVITKFIDARIKLGLPLDELILKFRDSAEADNAREALKSTFSGVTVTYTTST
ncbi:hypothetical protein GALMADRAFT_136148 [Galerina marginata CBS 339.88]|uniref:F-box domain-containing protein n=1 Tax=Galerina marginata (strain CBS 339.88) TaxID=685588 RepID=A0A067TFG4_GALM3|nr:hypothetical protein GALMADRAFT_136148 [Galerina marginata CBS 339.88]